MIEHYGNFSDLPYSRLPFIVLRPSTLQYRELSVRIDDEKWPTVRFYLISNHKEFRVKQFFMDWFFTGFPKSLLRDFSSSFSKVRNLLVGGTDFFFGKNYHGLDSTSGYYRGTQIEVECKQEATQEEFKAVLEDLLKEIKPSRGLEELQFPDRSFFSKGNSSQWFEDERVNRLNWMRTKREKFTLSGHSLHTSGMGHIVVKGKEQSILVLEENGFENAIWVEITHREIDLENAYYNVRRGENFYDTSEKLPDGTIIFRTPTGPGILRLEMNEDILTIGFSPGFSLEDIHQFHLKLENFCFLLNKIKETDN